MEKDKQVVELAIVGINYSITRLQRRIAKASQYLNEIESGKFTLTKKNPIELYEFIAEKEEQIKKLEELKFELEITLSE